MNPASSSRFGGDAEGFRALFDRFYRPISNLFMSRGFSSEASEDLAQETFLRASGGLGAFRGDAKTETWLFSIAFNVLRNHLRAQQTHKRKGAEISIESLPLEGERAQHEDADELGPRQREALHVAPDALAEVLKQEQVLMLRRAIEELPPQMRRCLSLRLFQGFEVREIAELLLISEGTVRVHLHEARKHLRLAMGAHFSDPIS